MSIIAAGTTTTTALVSTGNTDGTLQFQVNGTTPSVTLNALGAVGVGSTPNFGSSGQALLSAGSTTAPAWGGVQAPLVSGTNIKTVNGSSVLGSGDLAVGGGSWIFLSSVTASNSATVDIENTFNSTYDYYVIVANGVIPSTNGARIQAQLRVGGTYQTDHTGNAGYSFTNNSWEASQFGGVIPIGEPAGSSSDSWAGVNLSFSLYDPANTTSRKQFNWIGSQVASSGNSFRHSTLLGSGRFNGGTGAVTGVRFIFSTGNVSTGTFRLYGIKKS
jgi:hypothetical protein